MASKLRILICDDDPASRAHIEALAGRLCAALNAQADIEAYSDGALLLENYSAAADMVFLDIEMPLMDGIEVARELRRRDSGVCIVFMTNHEKYAIRGYEVGAWRYLLKPVDEQVFLREMEAPLLAALQAAQHSLCIKAADGVYRVEPNRLLYAETLPNHQLSVHTAAQTFTANTSIRALEEQLDPAAFFRCHTSYLVNFQYVAHIGAELTLKDGTRLPISRYRRAELLQRFAAYLGGKL